MTNHNLIRLLESIYKNSQEGNQYLHKANIKMIAAARVPNYESVLDESVELDYLFNFKDEYENECYQLI